MQHLGEDVPAPDGKAWAGDACDPMVLLSDVPVLVPPLRAQYLCRVKRVEVLRSFQGWRRAVARAAALNTAAVRQAL